MNSIAEVQHQPYFSVIMNCYNCGLFLREAIDSVYAQSFGDWEIVFFDNASTDSSAAITQDYDQRLRYIHNPENIPLGAARNRAVESARGHYLAFLDCDDVWQKEKLSLQAQALEQPPVGREYAFCYTDAMRIDESGKHLLPYSKERILVEGNVFLPLMRDCFIPMSSCVISRKVCLSLGGFDETLQHVEEWDLWLKTARLYDLAFVSECVTEIRFHSGNTSKDYEMQGREVLEIISRIEVDPHMQAEKARILAWFQVRFAVIHTAHELRAGFGRGFAALWDLTTICLRNPVVSFRLMRVYMSADMLRFFYRKYFQGAE